MNPAVKKLVLTLGLLGLVYAGGVAGYMAVEGWGFEDATFMTIITVAGVGYGEVHPLSSPGRWFTVLLIMCGMSVIVYGVSTLTAFIVEGELGDFLRRTKMEKQISKMSGHYILCGAGRVGVCILSELVKTGHELVVIEQDEEKVKEWRERHPEVARHAGGRHERRRPRGCRHPEGRGAPRLPQRRQGQPLHRPLRTGAQPRTCGSWPAPTRRARRDKLLRAGADSVVFPHLIGGMRMASEMIRPNVVSFLDTMLRERDGSLRVEEVVVADGSDLVGVTLAEADIPGKTGALLMAVRHHDRRFEFNPSPDHRLSVGDTLVVMGDRAQLSTLRGEAES